MSIAVTKGFGIAALAAMLTLAACDQDSASIMVGEVRLPNGLVVPQPSTLQVSMGDQLMVFTDPRVVRTPLRVEFAISAEPPPDTATSGMFDFSGVRSSIEESEGGSGGNMFELRAWRPVGGRWIMMTAEQQNEGWAPSFNVAWEMLDWARIED